MKYAIGRLSVHAGGPMDGKPQVELSEGTFFVSNPERLTGHLVAVLVRYASEDQFCRIVPMEDVEEAFHARDVVRDCDGCNDRMNEEVA